MDEAPARKVLSSCFRISNNTQFLCLGTTVGWVYFKLDESELPQLEESATERGGCALVSAFPVWSSEKQRADYSIIAAVNGDSSRVLQTWIIHHFESGKNPKGVLRLFRLPFETPILNIKVLYSYRESTRESVLRILVMTENELHTCDLTGNINETISLNAKTGGLLATNEGPKTIIAHAQTPFSGRSVGSVVLREGNTEGQYPSFLLAKFEYEMGYPPTALEFNAKGDYLAVGCEAGQTIKVRQFANQVYEESYQVRSWQMQGLHSYPIYSMAFSSHPGLEAPLLAVVSSKGTIHVFELINKELASAKPTQPPSSLLSLPGSPKICSVWKVQNFTGASRSCRLAFSVTGRLLAITDDGTFHQYTLETPRINQTMREGKVSEGITRDLLEKVVFEPDWD